MGWNIFLSKGQLISKGLFGILEFFQKTNERIRSFIHFLEESLSWKKHYDFVWPLAIFSPFIL